MGKKNQDQDPGSTIRILESLETILKLLDVDPGSREKKKNSGPGSGDKHTGSATQRLTQCMAVQCTG